MPPFGPGRPWDVNAPVAEVREYRGVRRVQRGLSPMQIATIMECSIPILVPCPPQPPVFRTTLCDDTRKLIWDFVATDTGMDVYDRFIAMISGDPTVEVTWRVLLDNETMVVLEHRTRSPKIMKVDRVDKVNGYGTFTFQRCFGPGWCSAEELAGYGLGFGLDEGCDLGQAASMCMMYDSTGVRMLDVYLQVGQIDAIMSTDIPIYIPRPPVRVVGLCDDLKRLVRTFAEGNAVSDGHRRCMIAIAVGHAVVDERGVIESCQEQTEPLRHKPLNYALSLQTEINHALVMDQLFWQIDAATFWGIE